MKSGLTLSFEISINLSDKSKINDSELIYSDEVSAMVEINFSRFNAKDEALSTTDAIYLLVYKNDKWLLKAGFIGSSLSLGQ